MTPLVDTHCHLDADGLPGDPDALVAEARAAGVGTIVMAGVDRASWDAQRDIARRHERVYAMFGLHPQIAYDLDDAELAGVIDDLRAAIADARAAGEGPVAIGETGLDGLTDERKAGMARQEESLRAHLALCDAVELPIVLHLLRADHDALRILKDAGLPARGGLVHSFSGSAELARQYADIGLHVSFCGTLTLPQSRRLREAAETLPLERIMIETDAPFQTPHPHQGNPCRPSWLPLVAQKLAEVKGLTVEEVAEATTANACRFFGIPRPG